jgi:hypothetical protein
MLMVPISNLAWYFITVIGGAPFGYFDWSMLFSLALGGAESAVLFLAAASAMDYCFEKGFISKFPA